MLVSFFKKIYLFIYSFMWLCWVLVVARKIFSCGMWDLGITSDQTQAPCTGSVQF